jgi:hypothetical protein
MSGYLEQMAEAIQKLQGEVSALKQQFQPPQQPQQFQPPQQFAQQPVQQYAQQPVQQQPQQFQQQPTGVQAPALPADPTQAASIITEYVMKHVDNPAIKTALGDEMRAMGIGALGETQPHQYAELFQRFHNAVARFGGQQAAPQQQANPSII